MGKISDTVAGLGIPRYSGEPGTIHVADGREVSLIGERLGTNSARWVGPTTLSMRMIQNTGMASQGSPVAWKYPADHREGSQDPDRMAFGFQIHKVYHPAEFWDAGLRLQEHLSAQMKRNGADTTPLPEIALQWYELAHGDAFLSPPTEEARFGVRLQGTVENSGYRMCSTGWQNSPVQGPQADKNWYPEIYLYGAATDFRSFTAYHRWVGGTVGGLGGNEQASKYPPISNVVNWHKARHIGAADLAAVPDWGDYSGRSRVLLQTSGTKQPIVRRDTASGFRYVRFASNDCMACADALQVDQPLTVFLVMRQNSGGGTQQVWVGPNQAGPTLLYRGDASNQVNVWAGGTDLTYDRAANWPSSWMIWSVVLNGASTTIWENLSQVASGNPGSTGITGLKVGANFDESLPANIDVAEIIVASTAANDTVRAGVVNYLNAYYGIF